MKFIPIIFIVYLLFFEDVLSQRIISRPELLLESNQQQQQHNQPVSPRGRGRARFSVTPEFEQVQADYEKTARQESAQRSRVSTPSKRISNNRRNYEVEEVLDDIPDSGRRYSGRPRVVTEMRFEAVNAPKDTTLFVPSEGVIEPEKDEALRNYVPSTLEAANHVSSTEYAVPSSSENDTKAGGDQTTEQEMMSKELMKSSTPRIKTEPVKRQRNKPVEEPAQTKPRTRTRKRPSQSDQSDSTKSSTTSASSGRKEDYLRKQELHRTSKPAGISEMPEKRTEPEPQPQTIQQIVQQPASKNNFRSGRRRSGSVEVAQQEKESTSASDFSRRFRGPSVFQDGQDLQPSRTRTGRRAVNASRRFPSRTTANVDDTSSTTEQQVRNRGEVRRGRNFSREPQQAQRLDEAAKETTTFVPRRRVPVRPTASVVNNPAPIRSRITLDSVKSETTTRLSSVQPSRSINRSRSRFNPTNIDEQKLEVLPLFETEPKTVHTNRQQSYNRRRTGKESTSNDSDQKKSRPRVVVTRKETVTEASKPPTFKPTVKESVHSEVSEVISTRKVTRPKPRGTKKANVTPAPKKSSGEDEIGESDNYPEPFKALLHKQQTHDDSKDGKNKSSRPRSAEDGVSDAADGTTATASSTAAPVSSSTPLAFAPDALSSSSTPSASSGTPSSASPSLLVDSSTVSSAPTALSSDENEVLPIINPTPIIRPTRRRFSLATKPPSQDATTKKPFVPSRKPTPSRPYKKYTTETLSVSVNSSTQRYHARFNGRADAPINENGDIPSGPPSVIHPDKATTFRRNFPTKSGTLPRKLIQDRPERKQIPIKGNKVVVDQQNNTSAPLKKHGHIAPPAANRYSSRYRGDLGARLHNAHAHSRGTTVVPVYVPTVPSITPSTTVSFPSPAGVHTEDNDLGLQVISIDELANSLYSDNLVVMGDNSTAPSSVPKEDNDQKKKSILERIINSLTTLSTTTTTAPPKNDLTNKRLAKKQTTNIDSNSSAIFKIASRKTKQSNSNQLIKPAQSNDLQYLLTDSFGVNDSSERPTTVIERIIDSLSAIQAIDSSTIDPIQVGTSANNLFNAPTKSMSFKRMSTIAPSSQSTIIPARSVGDFISSSPISGDTITMFLKLLNLDTARSTSTTQAKLFDLPSSTPIPIDSGVNNFQSTTFSPSFPPSTPQSTTIFSPTTPIGISTFSTTLLPTIFNSFSTNQPTTTSRPPLVRQFRNPTFQQTFSTAKLPSSLFTTDQPTTTVSFNNIVTNPITQSPVVTTTHNNLNDVEILSTVQPNRGSVRFQSTTTAPQTQTTVAISLADFLASLNQSPSTMPTNIPTLVPVTSTLPTVFDMNVNTVESTTGFRDLTTTLAPNTVTVTQLTNTPTTVTEAQELQNRGLLENFTVSLESVTIISANDLSQTTFSPDVLSILPLFSDITTTPQPITTTIQVTTTDTDTDTTTNSVTIDSNDLTTVTLASTTDLDNNILTSTDSPAMSQSQNMSQTSRLIAEFMRDNAIKPPTSDYYVFAVLPNNTIVRKRPRAFVPQDSPYIIVGVYPNNTVVHKYPNGTLVPEEPVFQVSGFDTRENPPPLPDITSNQVTSSTPTTSSGQTHTQGGDHTVDNTSTRMDNFVQNVASSSIEANLRSLDSSNSSSMIQSTTSRTPTTTITESNENSLVQLNEILGGKTIKEFNTIVNKTTINRKDAKEVEVLVTAGPNTEVIDIDNNVISTRAKPEKVIISTTGSPFTITENVSTSTIVLTSTNQPTTTRAETSTFIPSTTTTRAETSTFIPSTTTNARTTTTTDVPTTIFRTTTVRPTTQFRTTTLNPTTVNRFGNDRTTIPPFLANLLSTAIVQETNPPNVPTIFGISRATSNRPITTTEPYRGITTTATAPTTEIFGIQTTDRPVFNTQAARINVVPVTPASPSVNAPLDVQAILRLLEEYTGSTFTPRTVSRTTRRTTTAIYPTTDLENEIESSSRFVELITQSPNSRRRFRTTTVSTTIPTTTEVPTTLPTTTTAQPTTTPTTEPPTTTFIPTTQEPTTRRTVSRIRSTEVPTTTQRHFSPTIDPSSIDTETLIARAKSRPLTEQQKQDLATLEALENEQKALLEQLSLLTNLNGKENKPTIKLGNSNSNSLASRVIAFASERDRTTTTERIPELTLGEQLAAVTSPNQPKIAVINGKSIPVDELLKKINDNGINSVSSTYGSSNDAVLAAILKEQGIGPTTPEVLSNIYEDITTTRRTTVRTVRTTTARPAPGPIMQGLSWILNAIGPQNPPTNSPPRRFRTSPSTTSRPPTTLQTLEELQTQTSLRATQTTRAPTTTVQFKRPVNSLSDDELQKLISQLEAIQKDPRKAKELDLSNLKKLTTAPASPSQRLRDSVQLVHSGEQGTIPSLDEDVSDVYIRGRKAKSTTSVPVVSVSNSISAEDFDVDEEVVVVTRGPTRGAPVQLQQRPRQTLAPVQLNPIRGIDGGGSGPGQQGDGQVRGSLITAAVNVTRAISTFLGSAIQGAAQSFQAIIGSGSRQVGNYFGSGSIASRLG